MNQLQFLRSLVILNGAVPILMLAWDAMNGQVGANSVNIALHITGIMSLVFLFLSLLMTPLRWMTGWGGWLAFRRSLGLYGFFYVVVHLVIYVGFDRALNLSSTLNEIWTRRFLQVGTVAVFLMAPLAVTSTNAMIQRLGPKRWKLLHRAAYLVAILGVLHYYLLVKSDVRQPLAFAGVLTGLLGIRVGHHYVELRQASKKGTSRAQTVEATRIAPAAANSQRPPQPWKGELRIAATFQETQDVKTFRLMAADGGRFPFEYQPGQFLSIRLMIDGKGGNRSYTIASSPTRRDSCELSIKREPHGLASRYLHDQLQVGDVLKVTGPSGRFVFTGHDSDAVLLIAGGVGITPVMSIARYLTDRAWSGNIYFLIVAKTERDLIFRDELRWLKHRFPQLHICETLTRCDTSETWSGETGRLSGPLLTRIVPNLSQVPVYLCGPNEMMDATRELLRSVGIPESQIHTEAFAGKKSATADVVADFTTVAEEAAGPHAGALELAMTSRLETIRFTRSGIVTEIDSETTVLEAAEASSIELPYECRSGICGQCKTRLVDGRVEMDCEDALSATEKAAGFFLACQARPQSSLVVEA